MADPDVVPQALRPSSARGWATRERVLEAASVEFSRHGFDATSVESVAAAADITVSGMYKYFPTKQVLLLEVARWATKTSQARQALSPSPNLEAGFAALFSEYLAEGEEVRRRLSIELSRAANSDEPLRNAVVGFNELLRHSLADIIVESWQQGNPAEGTGPSSAPDEAALLAHLVLILLMGAIHLDTLDADWLAARSDGPGAPRLIRFLQDRFRLVLDDPGVSPSPGSAAPPDTVSTMDDSPEFEPADGRRARAVRTKRRILACSAELFALHGYDAASIELLSNHAEITVTGLYRHFESKEALFVAVAKRAFSRYRFANELRDDSPVATQLTDLLIAFSRSGDKVNRRLAIELDFGAWRSDVLAQDLQDFHRRVRFNVAAALAAQEGTAPSEDHELRALIALMMFIGVAHIDTVDPSLIDNEDWMDFLRRRIPQLISPATVTPVATSTEVNG